MSTSKVIVLFLIFLSAADAFSNPFAKDKDGDLVSKVENYAAKIKDQAGDFVSKVEKSAADTKNKAGDFFAKVKNKANDIITKVKNKHNPCCEGCSELVSPSFCPPPPPLLLLPG
jgi:uncharacterized protein (UPF0333 family)